jgi:hypothetical protein
MRKKPRPLLPFRLVIVGERTAVFGDVGELVEEGVIAVLGSCVLAEEALLLSM